MRGQITGINTKLIEGSFINTLQFVSQINRKHWLLLKCQAVPGSKKVMCRDGGNSCEKRAGAWSVFASSLISERLGGTGLGDEERERGTWTVKGKGK